MDGQLSDIDEAMLVGGGRVHREELNETVLHEPHFREGL